MHAPHMFDVVCEHRTHHLRTPRGYGGASCKVLGLFHTDASIPCYLIAACTRSKYSQRVTYSHWRK